MDVENEARGGEVLGNIQGRESWDVDIRGMAV